MSNKLVLHPSAYASDAGKLSVIADAKLDQGNLKLRYRLEAPANSPKVVWPSSSNGQLSPEHRKDKLWETTCLEAFILFLDGSYIEFNFAPQGLWNAYRFDSYREGMRPEERISAVSEFKSTITESGGSSVYELAVTVSLSKAVKAPQHFRLGLTSVIESEGGERSYWSLKHSGEKPDFHDSRGHVLEMRI